ncbi:ferredoxin [Streptomyces sp. NBC_01317]|uniref:ferredoxin n=1 Tax=Streptomyces sp. NBC_01317 TaxID=2903822 RepID=UPI002E153426|nr:ferredoxin [Streptomyces sp. NBC_01317]
MDGQLEVEVDRGRCVGGGMCVLFVPVVFDQSDDDGKVLLKIPVPGAGLTGSVRGAAKRCPSGAITLHERQGDAMNTRERT